MTERQDREPPTRLYRYRAASARDIEDVFVHGRIYFPSPEQLNDPFDCQPALLRPTSADIIGYLTRRSRRGASKANVRNLKQIAERRIRSPQYLRRIYDQQVARYGILSLCETSTSLLLWAHYADNHRGFCIEFDCTDARSMPIGVAMPVQYTSDRPTVHPLGIRALGPTEFVKRAFLTKSEEWSYEREWRCISDPGGASSHHPLQRRLISGVYFGARMNSDTRTIILDALKELPPSIKAPRVYAATINENKYRIDFSSLPA